MSVALGTCYYPEHWAEELWADDARRMAELGLSYVRVGEFAWSRIEPEPDRIELDWLERAMDTLGDAGLKIVLGTPTACPPKWLVDRMPSMLPIDATGQVRGFGSRRHYDFSHEGYRREAARIVRIVARRLGEHPALAMWQTDNEYGCHDTVLSYSRAALEGFRRWLANRYGTIEALNEAWGNVFWSMEYRSFSEIELPNIALTEPNPSHAMDFRRYSSDMVVEFDRAQTAIIRQHSPGRPISHNAMGRVLEFDHFALGSNLDAVTWDSYPLGFLEDRSDRSAEFKGRFLRQGDPDFQAMHHDLYRAASGGRWWVMEQQPGPVNWAPHNPVPARGMVRVWTWEAFAHGAECVSYFRWRQAPFAQEQMHAGLLRPDGAEAQGYAEATRVASELQALVKSHVTIGGCDPSPVAIVFDYSSAWAWDVQPQGAEFDYFRLVFDFYTALRAAGQDVDFVSSRADDWSAHRIVIVPGLFAWTAEARAALNSFGGTVLIGPRTGSKTEHFSIPDDLPPDCAMTGVVVERVETLPPSATVPCRGGGELRFWAEEATCSGDAQTLIERKDGLPALVSCDTANNTIRTLLGWPDPLLLRRVLHPLLDEAGLDILDLPDAVRVRTRGNLWIVTNYGRDVFELSALGLDGRRILGDGILRGHDVTILAKE